MYQLTNEDVNKIVNALEYAVFMENTNEKERIGLEGLVRKIKSQQAKRVVGTITSIEQANNLLTV